MKVITLITSSNKHGNSKKIVDRLTIGIEDAGGSNEVLFMDDKVRDADYFIFTAPIFYNDIAGHSKMFLDRFGSLGNDINLEMKEKKSLLMITHFSDYINDFVIKNTHRVIVSANFKVNKILDIGGLLTKRFTEDELESFEDIGYELDDYEVIPHELDLDSATV